MLKPMRGVSIGHLNSQPLENQTPPLAIPSLYLLAKISDRLDAS
jgi:hypothetical protein